MINKGIYKRYKPGVTPPEINEEPSFWFVFESNSLLVEETDSGVQLPYVKDLNKLNITPIRQQYLGTFDGKHCYSAEAENISSLPANMTFRELRTLYSLIDEDLFLLAGKALQIVNWDQTHQYCGRCGTPTKLKENERAKICPKCGFICFPRISPAGIVAVIKNKKILLAHANHFKNNMYSILAGFVEPGETIEECLKREVEEEVGIKIKNLKYFGSQPWPFPNSLMLGFTAEYESGDIAVDGVEISDAGWYSINNLPEIPSNMSIAGHIISWFIETYKE